MGEIKNFLCTHLEGEANWTSQWRGSSGPHKVSRFKSGKPFQVLGCQLWGRKWPGGGIVCRWETILVYQVNPGGEGWEEGGWEEGGRHESS